jgi:hypothetical protein
MFHALFFKRNLCYNNLTPQAKAKLLAAERALNHQPSGYGKL